jgi:adenylate cyclase
VGDALAEDLIGELSHFRELLVVGWQSSLACRPFAGNIARVARQLAVDYAVDGTVGRVDGRLSISVRLFDGPSASLITESLFNGLAAEVLSIEEEIARYVAGHLCPTCIAAGAPRNNRAAVANFEAYDLALRARVAIGRGGNADDTALISEGIALAEQATNVDRHCAEAYRVLALGHSLRGERGRFGPEMETDYAAAAALALRAYELDPLNYATHALSGHVAMRQMQHGEALARLRLACELNPNDVTTLRWLSWVEANHELPEAARGHGAHSLRLSPGDRIANQSHWPLALADYVANESAACVDHARQAVAMRPRFAVNYVLLSAALAEVGELLEAHYTLAAAATLSPGLVESRLAGNCYFVSQKLTERYVRALRRAAAGLNASPASPFAANAAAGMSVPLALTKLTAREREVLALVTKGHSNGGIARALGISRHTAKRHLTNILTKLDLPTRAAAASLAARHAIV